MNGRNKYLMNKFYKGFFQKLIQIEASFCVDFKIYDSFVIILLELFNSLEH